MDKFPLHTFPLSVRLVLLVVVGASGEDSALEEVITWKSGVATFWMCFLPAKGAMWQVMRRSRRRGEKRIRLGSPLQEVRITLFHLCEEILYYRTFKY